MVGKTALEGFQRPDNAERVRAIVEEIARQVAEGLAFYRMATVISLQSDSMIVEFADEPGSAMEIDLPALRPKNAGQNVEILVRNGTDYSLWRVFGDTALAGTTPDEIAPQEIGPTPVLATANRAITATWDPLVGITSYDVQRAKDSGFTVSQVTQTVIGTQQVVTNLNAGDGWWFRTRPRNPYGVGGWGNSASIVVGTDTPAATVPGVPTVPVVTNGELSQSITWGQVSNADHYELQWSQSSTFASGITTQVVKGNVFVRNGLTAGNTWYYRVRSVNTAGSSAYSTISTGATAATGIPAPAGAPVQVVGLALSSSNRSISAVWNPQAVATSYEVNRAKDSGFTIGNTTTTVSGSTLTLNNLIVGETWYYRVRAINSAGTGAYSSTVSIAVATDIPTAPGAPAQVTGLVLTSVPGQITAKWNAQFDSEGFEVQYDAADTFLAPTTLTVQSNQVVIGDLNFGQVYYFRVRGVNDAGNGPYSTTANKQVMLNFEYSDGDPPANSPTTTVRAGLRQLTAEWPVQANADLVTYEVHISATSGFTPNAGTKLGETTGTFWITDHLPGGTSLVEGTTYFMRVIAKDADGAATPGAQGSGAPQNISLGEVGDVTYDIIVGDGSVPGTPAAPTISSGIGYLYAKWTRPVSPDPLSYEVHVSTNSAFVPDANTLSLETNGLFGFIRKQGPGAGNADLVYGTTYYVKIIAKDIDGVSAPSAAGSGFTVKAAAADMVAGTITAASGIIADLAIGTAKIQDGAIQTAKIGDLQVNTAKIADGAIQTAKIGDAQVLTAKIGDAQITTLKVADGNITSAKIQTLSASKIDSEYVYAALTVANVIRTSVGTARVEMNTSGIFGYDSGGGTLFSINAASGSAYFRGNIYAVDGTFTGNISSSATITGGTLVGAYKSAASGTRIEIAMYNNGIQWYDSGGTYRGSISADGNGISVSSTQGNTYIASTYGTSQLGQRNNAFTTNNSTLIECGQFGGITMYARPYISSQGAYVALSGHGHSTELNDTHSHSGYATAHSHPYASSTHEHSYITNFNTGSGSMQLGDDGTYVRMYTGGGSQFRANRGAQCNWTGSKTFVIEHPDDADKYLVHAAIEGPTADVFYRGEGKLDGSVEGKAVIELPGYFETLTELEGRTVTVTPILGCDDDCPVMEERQGRDYIVPNLAASRVVNGKFTVKFIGGWDHRCASFFWEVKAVRKNTQFAVEPTKNEVVLQGDGPYTYLTPA